MIDINKAKQKILDLAIRGKLTKQHHKDGNINDEIKYYINNVEIENEFKKNKKQVKINVIEELPFDIPKTWSWVRLGNVCSIFGRIGYRGYTKDDIVEDGNGAISLSPSNLVGFGKMDYSNCTYISWDKYNESPEIMVNNEDIIIVKTGSSYGKTGFVSNLQKRATINPQLAILKYLQGNRKYILIILNTVFAKKQLDDFVLGSAVPTFSQEDLANLMIPIPPLAEQNRIVEKVEHLFDILDKIDEAQKTYQKDKDMLKSKIIEAGIRGKLTKQLKSDGDAKDLYDKIQKEKEKLIKEKKIRNDKIITSEELDELFEIPKNWKWCRLGEITEIERGGSPRPIKSFITFDESGTNWIKIGDVEKSGKYITKCKEKIIKAAEKHSRKVYPGDFLLTNSMSFGRPYISKIEGCIHDGWLVIRGNNHIYISDYLYYYLSSQFSYNQFCESASGATVDNLNIDKVKNLLFVLPPLAEQKRIVEVIEKILCIINDK